MAHQKFVIWIMSDPSLNTKSHLFSRQIADSSFRMRSYTKYILFHNICKIENFSAPFLHFTSSGASICRVPHVQVTGACIHPASVQPFSPPAGSALLGSTLLSGLSLEKPRSLFLWTWRNLSWDLGLLQCPLFCVGEHRCWHSSAEHFLPAVISLGPAEGAH